MSIIFAVVTLFIIFYLINYIGQKLMKTAINQTFLLSLSIIEAVIVLGLFYYRPFFL
ncbi:conserved hypothetical protein [Bacillus spizizenii TU-B-10]|uniref:Uncharacterized protein n=1 Tax=Bacillus spizizenii (strain DSM 15029 / JCM 12233 / NBRC 101239 / NRRL B-23049 / TU-B-10) TaxID=1052585 RepID=G4P0D9_BACS4|nr:conserved hypothetical protein [Bacillus spizizenii TU-B-10]SCV39114.1 hypothetical protein BQ1740_0810 [Bacillus subtilis]